MAEPGGEGLLDTSVIIDHDIIDADRLPLLGAVATVTVAELFVGPVATDDVEERARRQDRLAWTLERFDPLPFDVDAARSYGRVVALTRAVGRLERSRVADLMVAATAAANGLPLYTRNAEDLTGLDDVVAVQAV